VLLVRDEGLQADALTHAGRLWDLAGLECTRAQLEEAVHLRSFARRRRTGPGGDVLADAGYA
jgi:hypothetical protein